MAELGLRDQVANSNSKFISSYSQIKVLNSIWTPLCKLAAVLLTGNPTIVQFEIPNCLINATNTITTSPQIMFEFERYYPFQKKQALQVQNQWVFSRYR